MTPTAAQQMKELYPATGAYLHDSHVRFVTFRADVNAQFKLLDRLLLSLCDEVTVETPTALKNHLETALARSERFEGGCWMLD